MKLNNKGSSLYFAVAIIAIIMAIALATTSILITQIRIIREMSNSVLAIYAADAGMERVLFEIRVKGIHPDDINKIEETLSNDSEYEIDPKNIQSKEEEDCDAENFCIKTIGKYRGVQRSMETKF